MERIAGDVDGAAGVGVEAVAVDEATEMLTVLPELALKRPWREPPKMFISMFEPEPSAEPAEKDWRTLPPSKRLSWLF
ncbi:MAG: hypothetical protein AAGB34_10095 [Planctomycetota bacterium]